MHYSQKIKERKRERELIRIHQEKSILIGRYNIDHFVLIRKIRAKGNQNHW